MDSTIKNIVLLGIILLNSASYVLVIQEIDFSLSRDYDESASCQGGPTNVLGKIVAEHYRGDIKSCDISAKGELHPIMLYCIILK